MRGHRGSARRLAAPIVLLATLLVVYAALRIAFTLPHWLEAIPITAIGISLARLVLAIVVRFHVADTDDNDAVGAAFGAVAAIYALLFGFIILVGWQDRAAARSAMETEANALVEITRMARGLEPEVEHRVQTTTARYLGLVLDEEWPALAEGRPTDAGAAALAELWVIYTGVDAEQTANPLYAQSIARLNELNSARTARLAAGKSAIDPLLWFLMYTGAALTVVLACFFRVSRPGLQRLLITSMAALITLAMFGMSVLDNPFDPRLPISPGVFTELRTE